MEIQIKKVKDFVKDGPPQFCVIGRCKPGITVTVTVCSSIIADTKTGFSLDNPSYNEVLYPNIGSGNGLIKSVRRIKDGQVMNMSDSVTIAGSFHHLVGFSEDLIHCFVVNAYSDKPEKEEAEINSISEANSSTYEEEDFTSDEDLLAEDDDWATEYGISSLDDL